jgi:hypothetical protein
MFPSSGRWLCGRTHQILTSRVRPQNYGLAVASRLLWLKAIQAANGVHFIALEAHITP